MSNPTFQEFFDDFIELCKKYNMDIEKESLSFFVGPVTKEYVTGHKTREVLYAKEIELKFNVLQKPQIIYEQEI